MTETSTMRNEMLTCPSSFGRNHRILARITSKKTHSWRRLQHLTSTLGEAVDFRAALGKNYVPEDLLSKTYQPIFFPPKNQEKEHPLFWDSSEICQVKLHAMSRWHFQIGSNVLNVIGNLHWWQFLFRSPDPGAALGPQWRSNWKNEVCKSYIFEQLFFDHFWYAIFGQDAAIFRQRLPHRGKNTLFLDYS